MPVLILSFFPFLQFSIFRFSLYPSLPSTALTYLVPPPQFSFNPINRQRLLTGYFSSDLLPQSFIHFLALGFIPSYVACKFYSVLTSYKSGLDCTSHSFPARLSPYYSSSESQPPFRSSSLSTPHLARPPTHIGSYVEKRALSFLGMEEGRGG